MPSININISETKYTEKTSFKIDFSWYSHFKEYTDIIITVFIYVSFFWRLFTHLPHTISGNNVSSSDE